MARPPYSAPLPSARFICLILLQSLLLDFPCATLASAIALELFLNVRCALLKMIEESLIE